MIKSCGHCYHRWVNPDTDSWVYLETRSVIKVLFSVLASPFPILMPSTNSRLCPRSPPAKRTLTETVVFPGTSQLQKCMMNKPLFLINSPAGYSAIATTNTGLCHFLPLLLFWLERQVRVAILVTNPEDTLQTLTYKMFIGSFHDPTKAQTVSSSPKISQLTKQCSFPSNTLSSLHCFTRASFQALRPLANCPSLESSHPLCVVKGLLVSKLKAPGVA